MIQHYAILTSVSVDGGQAAFNERSLLLGDKWDNCSSFVQGLSGGFPCALLDCFGAS